MGIREYLKKNNLICDGAFGTYYASKGNGDMPERANLEQTSTVLQIHQAYIAAGARMIRTNTFASNTIALQCNREQLEENITAGYQLAEKATESAEESVYIAGDIGPLPETRIRDSQDLYDEYYFICETFIKLGAKILLFETFANLDVIEQVIADVKKENPELFVIVQFCVNQHGYTETGISAKRLMELVSSDDYIEATGFNCGVGPGHLYQIMSHLELPDHKYITALPNASYPQNIQDRIVFMENMDYFTEKVHDIEGIGASILGGCCGTDPKYIRRLAQEIPRRLDAPKNEHHKHIKIQASAWENGGFLAHKKPGEKLIAVELSPPPNADFEKIMDSANLLKNANVDVLTFPDSPSGRTRADSILMAVKIANEVKIDVMPHICCRDKNAIAIRSQLLGAHINGIKNLLVITGDPVPATARQEVKSVFNYEAVGMMRTIQEMNREQFAGDEMVYGGALNYNRLNLDVEIGRMRKKIEAGAKFFMTQPLFGKEDAEKLRYIRSQVDTRIICGVMPLISLKNATFMKNEMAGIDVPDSVLARYRADMTREEGEAVGVAVVREVMQMTESFVDGYYFSIPFNRVYLLKDMLDSR
ncbi:MAG: bifunctional homocysteine S-methyltransferase/methylenetetrahydrofolate reductase [Lachnospiraceae bacterium]|nr:bifunctional homocysteine S-methyltransferase/methylenetetrahydrofolate reductase [Lachnospiraceae bacterium]